MIYKPVTAVWEITMGCNMRCKHCGSSCENALEGELTTDEALKLCKDLGQLGFQWITLSGGEPTTRKDWHLIAQGLNENGVVPNLITNGWLLDQEFVEKAVASGINTVAISVDGLEDTHDHIRKKGSFERIMKAFGLMEGKDLHYSVITTIHHQNIHELNSLKQVLIERGVEGWQLQLGLPMGNMLHNQDMVAQPYHMDDVIDFAYETMQEGKIDIQLADCIGYYNKKEIEVRRKGDASAGYLWQGCGAGKYSMGILHNGDILGCTSVRDRSFIEGNIRETPVQEIWNDPERFSWNRNITKEKLQGLCGKCRYGHLCLGGCSNTRLTMEGSVYSENRYCSYHVAVSKARVQLEKIENVDELKEKARKFMANKSYQLAEILLSKALEKEQGNIELLSLYGFVNFMLANYTEAKVANEKVLSQCPEDAYANKGLGLTLCRMGKINEGIEYLKTSIELADESFMDPYYDLALVLMENERQGEALAVLEAGRNKSEEFKQSSKELYEQLIS